MSSKFDKVPVEEDTTIIGQREVALGEYQVLYQMWSWDGVNAESLIFSSDDVASLSDTELEGVARSSPFVQEGSNMTIQRSDSGYVFVNFNFEAQ